MPRRTHNLDPIRPFSRLRLRAGEIERIEGTANVKLHYSYAEKWSSPDGENLWIENLANYSPAEHFYILSRV